MNLRPEQAVLHLKLTTNVVVGEDDRILGRLVE